MRLSDAFEKYRQDVITFQGQSIKTEESHTVATKSLLAHVGDIKLRDLTFEHVRCWKQSLDKRCSPSTVRGYIIKIRVVLAYLRLVGVDCLDPALIPPPKRADKVPSCITEQQVKTLITSTEKIKNKAIVALLYASGIRISELCNLDRQSIREDGTFTVMGKGGKARLCFTDERAMTLIELYLESRTDRKQPLFLTDHKTRITPGTIQDTFRSIRTRSGIDCSPHTLRHSYATNLLRNNANMRYVQVLLGHQSLQTTQMYTHVVDHDLKEVYKKYHTV